MNYLVSSFILIILLLLTKPARADYILPYPSVMPGNKLYTLVRVFDEMKKWWYWGNIAKVKYYQALSDKNLVEAKVLFEYKQYLLGHEALVRSTSAFLEIPQYIAAAKRAGKNSQPLEALYQSQAQTHIEVLQNLAGQIPSDFTWVPERGTPTALPLGEDITRAIQTRQAAL
jgi:hypothetical protein